VEVRLGRTENGSRLGVIDTGQGISAELLPHVFERFRQGPGPQTREGEGLGLGLAIAREIVQRHGGTISVSSPGRGRGATFTVDLPARTPGPLESGQAPAARPAPQARGALRGIRVLVVDDDADTTELIAMVVAEHGAEAAAVVSVTDARLALAKSPPQVLICDLAMPGEDGLGFIREVRAASHERARDIFAIAVSGYARPEDRARALSAGFNAYLAKPLDPMVLVELVSRGSRGEPWAETDASPGPERDTG
jgi:CheY-like chemotaxis protein